MPCYSPLKGYRNIENGGIVFKRCSVAGEKMEVACGQCLGCRLDRSRMWATRIVHESKMWRENCFITLTYDDEHLPSDGSLVKSDFQKFMKRLRKHFKDRRIRYYQCGEYGETQDGELGRPHYHACLFNLDFPDKKLFGENQGNPLFVSETLSKIWGLGFTIIGDLTFQSAAYVARYIMKKINGHNQDSHYEKVDIKTGEVYWLLPEYTTMSRRPGIGRDWYEKYKDDVFPSDEVPVSGIGVLPKVPRYYEEILRSESECDYEAVKLAREVFRRQHGDEYTPERLMSKYKIKKAQMGMLRRNKI